MGVGSSLLLLVLLAAGTLLLLSSIDFFFRSTVASACNDRATLPQPARPRGLQCGFGVAEGGRCYGVLAWFDLAVLVGKVVRLASASRPQRCGSATAYGYLVCASPGIEVEH